METTGGWLCLMVNGAFRQGDRGAVEKELRSVFGEDAGEMRSVCNDDMRSSTGEYYVFVRCRGYERHVDRLSKSAAVVSVVPSSDKPHWFSDEELREFEGSVAAPRREEPREMGRGDMVLVKDGYLKNLYGVVRGKAGPRRYKVCFSLHVRKFSEILNVTVLDFVANVFRRMKSGKGASSLVSHHKLRGKPGGGVEAGEGEG